MPSLRLTRHEAVAIATYLTSRSRNSSATKNETDLAYLKDEELGKKGKSLTKYYGCAGCHEIKGLESEGRIGVELTYEGSKDVSLLDFGHLTEDFKHAGQETKWDWFETKLRNPRFFDDFKLNSSLRMPNFKLSDKEVKQVATFILGSVDKPLKRKMGDYPEGLRKDIAEGWWLVKQYNCVGCHQVQNQGGTIRSMPGYAGAKQAFAPPILNGEGTRVQPNWVADFLRNPYTLRPWLAVRMPTFHLTDSEATKIARFFSALNGHKTPYIAPHYAELDAEKKEQAANMITQLGCFKCHVTNETDVNSLPEDEKAGLAPNLVLTRTRLKPSWVLRWLQDPQGMMPGTKMPTFFDASAAENDAEREAALTAFQKSYGAEGLSVDEAYQLIIHYLYTMTEDEAASTAARLNKKQASAEPVAPAEGGADAPAEGATGAPVPAQEDPVNP